MIHSISLLVVKISNFIFSSMIFIVIRIIGVILLIIFPHLNSHWRHSTSYPPPSLSLYAGSDVNKQCVITCFWFSFNHNNINSHSAYLIVSLLFIEKRLHCVHFCYGLKEFLFVKIILLSRKRKTEWHSPSLNFELMISFLVFNIEIERMKIDWRKKSYLDIKTYENTVSFPKNITDTSVIFLKSAASLLMMNM